MKVFTVLINKMSFVFVVIICLWGCDIVIYNNMYLVFYSSPRTELVKPLEFPEIRKTKVALVM